MTWSPRYRYAAPYGFADRPAGVHPLRVNEHCFIRKEHRCGKIFGASKSCFIACPTDDELEPILALLSEKLSKAGVEPIIAVKERAYGQDIFCTKICGKIIEARFCLVILDDTITERGSIPNPNVYYEYGLMTSLRKHIIPLQKADLDLAFNIQSYDTIKYSPKNIASELDRAIKDAIRMTESKDKEERSVDLPDRTILRKFELAGFELKGDQWFLSEVIDDTLFRGFSHPEKRFYLYLGKIDESEELQTHLEDLDVVLYRTEKAARELEENLARAKERQRELTNQIEEPEDDTRIRRLPSRNIIFIERELRETESKIVDIKSKQEVMDRIHIGLIMNEDLDSQEFTDRVRAMVGQYEHYEVAFTSGTRITFGEVEVTLERSQA
jgi:hypothetical protein